MAGNFGRKLRLPHIHFRVVLDATNTLSTLSKGRRAEDFFALKNPMASARFEPANLGTKFRHATSRTPKPLCKLVLRSTWRVVTVGIEVTFSPMPSLCRHWDPLLRPHNLQPRLPYLKSHVCENLKSCLKINFYLFSIIVKCGLTLQRKELVIAYSILVENPL